MPTAASTAERRNRLKRQILERMREGETAARACAALGVSVRTAFAWAAVDPGFRWELDDAIRRGTHRRKLWFDEAAARAVLARLAAGETWRALERDPTTPSRRTLWLWRQDGGWWFGAEVGRLMRVRRGQVNREHLARPKQPWSPATADRALYLIGQGHRIDRLAAADAAMPSITVLRRWRREQPWFDRAVKVNQRAGRVARARARRRAALGPLLDGIIAGGTLASLAGTRGLPRKGLLYRWAAEDRDFREAVAEAYDDRDRDEADARLAQAEAAGPGLSARRARALLGPVLSAPKRRRPGMPSPAR